MSTKTLISVDLDWLNGTERPITKLKVLLRHIPKNIPTVMTVEHHEFMPHLHRWIKEGKVSTPFSVLNIDEHHDYYWCHPPHHPDGTGINCGNWGYRMPLNWYNKYTWIPGATGGEFDYWEGAQEWLSDRNIQSSVRNRHRLSELNTKIVAAVFCVSPDYLEKKMLNHVSEAIEIIARHCKLRRAPTKISSTRIAEVDGWRIAPRPIKGKK